MFMIGIAAAWARGLEIECGCFGATGGAVVDPTRGYALDLFRDAGLPGCWLARRAPASRSSTPIGRARRPAPGPADG